MESIILDKYPDLFSFIGVAGGTACGVKCDLCGKDHPDAHEGGCDYGETGRGNCDCETVYRHFNIGGIQIVDNCCGKKIMTIIACLMPEIVEKVAPLLIKEGKNIIVAGEKLSNTK
jgi:hypothetical protein